MAFATLVWVLAAAARSTSLVEARSGLAHDAPYTTWQSPRLFNMTINDTSAMWAYSPSMTGGGASGNDPSGQSIWNTSFSRSDWARYTRGDAGLGASKHTASARYATAQAMFNFPMTAFRILGDVDHLDYNGSVPPLQLIVDSRTPMYCTPTPGVICAETNLVWGYHKVELSLFSGNWTIRGIEVTTGAAIDTLGNELNQTTAQIEQFLLDNETLNPFYTYSGDWEVADFIGLDNDIEYKHLTGKDGAYVNFTVPPETSFVYVNGTVGPESDQFKLEWDPLPPLADAHMLFSAFNYWQAPALLYAIPLDPTTNYTLSMGTYSANDFNPQNGTSLGLHSVSFFRQETNPLPPRDSGPNKGAIAGGVVGGAVAVGLIAAALVWCVARRRRKRRQPLVATTSKFDVDNPSSVELDDLESVPEPEPYVAPPPRAEQKRPTALDMSDAEQSNAVGSSSFASSFPSSSRQDLHMPTQGGLAPLGAHLTDRAGGTTTYPSSPSGTMGSTANLIGTKDGPGDVPQLAAELKHGPSVRRPARPRQVAQEEDGGTLDEYEILPPVYNPEWARARDDGPSRQQGLPLSPTAGEPPRGLSVVTSLLGGGQMSPAPTPTTATTATTATTSPTTVATHSPVTTEHSPTHLRREGGETGRAI